MGNKKPKVAETPSPRNAKIAASPQNHDADTITWQFNRLDRDHKLWGWNHLNIGDFEKIVVCLQCFEGMTWSKLKAASIHHAIEVGKFTKNARDRLDELNLDDIDELFSLHLQSTIRVYGIRDGRALKILWHDPNHIYSNKDAAYYVTKK